MNSVDQFNTGSVSLLKIILSFLSNNLIFNSISPPCESLNSDGFTRILYFASGSGMTLIETLAESLSAFPSETL